jgi:prophage antirepressor-like protein
MQNKIQVYENNQFGSVRVIDMDGQPWWVLTDVCKVLGLTTPTRVAERLDSDEVSQTHIIDRLGRNQKASIITESGLYAVILRLFMSIEKSPTHNN